MPHNWWKDELTQLSLPGGPLAVSEVDGRHGLTRQQVWHHAANAAEDDNRALRLLWHSLAWGAGPRLRQCRKRMEAVANDVRHASRVLRKAAELSQCDREAAYDELYPCGRPALPYLGRAFGTKYLYFAGSGAAMHSSLILDSRVATTLHRLGWDTLNTSGGWPASTYGRYCALAERWAAECTADSGTLICADQVEHWLFNGGVQTPPRRDGCP